MNVYLPLAVVCLLLGFPAFSLAVEYPERWNYVSANILTEASTDRFIGLLKQSRAAGCTHLLWAGCRGARIPELTPEQIRNAERVREEARRLALKIVPSIVSIGYSGRYFHFDPNLAAGVPVKNMPFIVSGKTAVPDPALALDAAQLRKEGSTLAARYKVRPFTYYRVSLESTAEPGDREAFIKVTSSGGKRWNSRTNPVIKKNEDGTYRAITVFNTLEGDEIRFSIDCSKGEVSDVKIEPAGLLLVLRRALIPLTVTSEDGKTLYEEGKDFKAVADAPLQIRPFPGDFPIDHQPPAIELTGDSSIADGQKLLVSFWHHVRIYDDQDLMSMEDPATWKILEREITETVKLWPTEGYMLNYDEIRVAGWEPRPDGRKITPGQMLAEHFRKACDLVKKHAPKARLYTWSDMFTPHHNARAFEGKGYYYLSLIHISEPTRPY